MTSIHNNSGANVALATLTSVNKNLLETQSSIATGKTVNSAADNSAIWAVTTVLAADVDGFNAISESLSFGKATVTVARNAAEKVTDILTDIKELIVTAQVENVDREKIQTDIDELKSQVETIVGSAQFNGLNLLDGSEAEVEIISSLDRSESGVTASTITVEAQDLSVGGANTGTILAANGTAEVVTTDGTNVAFAPNTESLTINNIVGGSGTSTLDVVITNQTDNSQVNLGTVTVNDADTQAVRAQAIADFITSTGTDLISATANGNDVDFTSTAAFDDQTVSLIATSGSTTGGTTAALTPGIDSLTGISDTDTIQSTFTFGAGGVNNGETYDITINGVALTQINNPADTNAASAALANAINTAVAANPGSLGELVAVDATGGVVNLTYSGSEDLDIQVTTGGAATADLAFDSGNADNFGDLTITGITTGVGTVVGNGANIEFAAVTAGNGYSLDIRKDLNGDGTTEVTSFEYVAGTNDTSTDVANALRDLVQADSRFSDVYIETLAASDNPTNEAGLRIDTTGGDIDVALKATIGGASGGGLSKLGGLDVTSNASAAQALDDIEILIQTSIDAASAFGSSENRLDVQADFISSLVTSVETGIGVLVDTDLEEASARLQALQVQQQLATQALSIANAAPQNILSLFR